MDSVSVGYIHGPKTGSSSTGRGIRSAGSAGRSSSRVLLLAALLGSALGACSKKPQQPVVVEPIPTASPSAPAPVVFKKTKGTVFFVGEAASEDNGYIQNTDSVYQWGSNHWLKHHGCADTEKKPCDGKENSFYVAVPATDMKDEEANPKVRKAMPAAWLVGATNAESSMKNRWVVVRANGKVGYGQIQDAGPFGEEDVEWVFGSATKPKSKANSYAGIDLSPALANHLGVSGVYDVEFALVIDANDVPPGPWRAKVTTSGVSY